MSRTAKQIQREQSHERILDAAARAVCRDGYAGVGVANVMKEAGMTHGGFYAHFDSREALLAEAIEHAGGRSIARLQERMRGKIGQGVSPLRALIESYLSVQHMEAVDQGCPVAALGTEMPRAGAALRDVAAQRVRELVGFVEQALLSTNRPGGATAIVGAMVGAIQMARMLDGTDREAVLSETRAMLLAQFDRGEGAL
jgi:TetR/AcrR family transcriptional regulator, transcriptional repressor for nem operon